jgi:hypothetical protein
MALGKSGLILLRQLIATLVTVTMNSNLPLPTMNTKTYYR